MDSLCVQEVGKIVCGQLQVKEKAPDHDALVDQRLSSNRAKAVFFFQTPRAPAAYTTNHRVITKAWRSPAKKTTRKTGRRKSSKRAGNPTSPFPNAWAFATSVMTHRHRSCSPALSTEEGYRSASSVSTRLRKTINHLSRHPSFHSFGRHHRFPHLFRSSKNL